MAAGPEDKTPPPPPAGSTPPAEPGKIAVVPRQNAAPERPPSSAEASPDLTQQLASALARVLGANAAANAPTAPLAERGLMGKEEKRFRRAGGGESAPPTAEPAGGEPYDLPVFVPKRDRRVEGESPAQPDAPKKEMPRGELDQAALDAERGHYSRPDPPPRGDAPSLRSLWRRSPGLRVASTVAGALAAAALCFVAGRQTAPEVGGLQPAVDRTAPKPLAESTRLVLPRLAENDEIKRIDEASLAQTEGNFAKAEETLLALARDAPELRGNQLALAHFWIQKGNFSSADYHISLGLAGLTDDAGQLYAVRGLLQAASQRPRKANESYELATRAAPYDWRNFFLWSEHLRRAGKNQQALEMIDKAIARVHEQGDEDLMQFKRRLILIALGRGEEIDAPIAAHLASAVPAAEWLLTAMAREANRGDFSVAAKPLKRATELVDEERLGGLLRDFFLYQWCFEKELEPLFRSVLKQMKPLAAPPATASDKPEAEEESPLGQGLVPKSP